MTRFEKKFPHTASLLHQAVDKVFPAYAAGVWNKGEAYFGAEGCAQDSLFDLASLTKVLCTTTLCAAAEEKAVLEISEPLKAFFPKFPDPRVKLSHLLDHSSGFPSWLPLHERFHAPGDRGEFDPRATPAVARVAYEEEILKSWSSADFEKKVTYSDLGMMLLGWALEIRAGQPVDALFQEWVAGPAGLSSLQFLPTSPDVVPTELCPWRGHILRGEVHDDNCYVLGGVCAHAGLFGNVQDVLKAALLWLAAFRGEKTLIVPATARRYFTFTHMPGSVRSLGWDGIARDGTSAAGRHFSPATRGHLGFTGTSLWVDPEKNLIVVLLTNRVHPTRSNEKIKSFRSLFHDSLLEELGFAK
ncbi:MAG: serine hydrolase [Deltaproteobacteria bacterium]|nr:serine hydrolase [Deltaproteobacteria bacterium]